MEKGSKTRLLTAGLLAAVFASGILLGLVADRSLRASPAESAEETDDGRRERRVPMYEQVGPSEGQKILIDSIVTDHRAAMRALQEEFRAGFDPRYQALVLRTREAIKSVFSPEQALVYDSLLAEFDRRRAERDARGDGSRR